MSKRMLFILPLMAGMLGAGYFWGFKTASQPPVNSQTPNFNPAVAQTAPSPSSASNTPGAAAPGASTSAPATSGTTSTAKTPADTTAPRSTSPTFPNSPVSSEFSNIRISAPPQDDIVSSPVKIKGQARVFEAQFKIVIQDGQDIIANQQVQASAGAPEWGNFEVNIPFEQPKTGNGQIIFYTMSPKDGSPIVQAVWPVRFRTS